MGIRLSGLSVICVFTCCAFAQSSALDQRLEQGQQLRISGRYEEAREGLRALLRDAEREDASGLFASTVLDNLAMTEQDLANYREAERLMSKAIAQFRRLGDAGRNGLATVQGHLGETYLEQARYHDAEPILRKALEMRENDETADPEARAVAMLDLAVAYEHTGKVRDAEALLRQSLAILEARRGMDHPIVAAALGPLASILMRSGRYQEALLHTERAWKILSGNPAVAEPDILNTISSMGTLFSLTGRFREAEIWAQKAVARGEAIYGPDHPRLGWYLKAYADVLQREGRKAEAKALQKRSAAILTRNSEANPVHQTINVNALR